MDLSKKAKAILFHKVGGPDVLGIEEVVIAPPGAHEVRLEVKAIGINRIDTVFRMGLFEPPVFPSKIGFEASGIIESVGSAVTDFKQGDRVSVVPSFSNKDYGTYGDLILLPVYAIQHFPEKFSFEEGAAIWTTFITAYGMLIDSANLQPGEFVLLNAASSSMGLSAIQIINMAGAIPIAITTSADKKEALHNAGAKHVIVAGADNISARVHEITSGKGANVILDAVGGKQFEHLVDSSAERAKIFAYGTMGIEQGIYPTVSVVIKMLSVIGYSVTELLTDQVKSKVAIQFVKEGLQSGKLKPVLAKFFSLEESAQAHRYLEANNHFGKIVLSLP